MYTLDDLYGCTLEEYLIVHNTTVEELLNRAERNIKLLKLNLQRIADKEPKSEEDLKLYLQVDKMLENKRKHLNHLKLFVRL